MGADAWRPLGAAGGRGSAALGRAGRHRHVEVAARRRLVGRHLRDRVAGRGRDRQPTARGRRAARRRSPGRQLLRRGRAARGRRGGTHRARDRAGADERRAHLTPARRHRDPPAPPGGVACGFGGAGRGSAGEGDPGGARGRAGHAADARRPGPDRTLEDGGRRRRLRAHAAGARRGAPAPTSACGASLPGTPSRSSSRTPPPAASCPRSWWKPWG